MTPGEGSCSLEIMFQEWVGPGGGGRGTNHLMHVNCRSTHNNTKTDWINSPHKQRHTPPPQRMAVCYGVGFALC